MLRQYIDMNGVEIKAGNTIKHVDGTLEKVYACRGSAGEDLGVSASNPDFIARHPEAEEVYYPLSEFTISEWEVVDSADNQ